MDSSAYTGLAEKLPDVPAQRLRRLRLQTAYGNALLHARGQTAAETIASFARARELAAGVEDVTERASAYYGSWDDAFVRAEVSSTREIAKAFLSDVQRRPGTPEAGFAPRIFGTTLWF
jgi:D-serine deaminase-like pyridoxal phosphate-dependent protein